jgi:hypothetical protein
MNCKGSGTMLTKNPYVYVLSNYRIDECYADTEKLKSLHARFVEYELMMYNILKKLN